jgi:hypothetical protein
VGVESGGAMGPNKRVAALMDRVGLGTASVFRS